MPATVAQPFTPAPWDADADSGSVSHRGDQIASAWVPRRGSENPLGERYANIHLIAAAPDLYEALAMFVAMDGRNNLSAMKDIARAALAKARGEQP